MTADDKGGHPHGYCLVAVGCGFLPLSFQRHLCSLNAVTPKRSASAAPQSSLA